MQRRNLLCVTKRGNFVAPLPSIVDPINVVFFADVIDIYLTTLCKLEYLYFMA